MIPAAPPASSITPAASPAPPAANGHAPDSLRPAAQPHAVRFWSHPAVTLVLAAALFALLAGGLTWPRLAHATNTLVDLGDPLEDVWTLDWIDHALLTDPAHLYDAPIFYGFPRPLAYDDTSLGPALVALPLTLLTGNRILAYNLLIVGSFALAGWAAFVLARHVTRSTAAGLVAGMAFAFWSYTFAHLSHLSVLSLYPLPLALYCLHRLFEAGGGGYRRRAIGWAAGFAACAIWQALNSFYYIAYLGLVVAALLLWEGLVVRRWRGWTGRDRARVAGLLGLAGAAIGLALALLSAPYREVQQDLGFYRSAEEQTAWAARPLDYLSVSPRNRVYRTLLPNAWPEPLFPGFAGLALGALGLAAHRRRRTVRPAPESPPALHPDLFAEGQGAVPPAQPDYPTLAFYALLAGGAFVLSLGPTLDLGAARLVPLPYQWIAALPGFSGLRAPVRLAALVALGGGVLAGAGWAALLAWPGWRSLSPRERAALPLSLWERARVRDAALTLLLLAVMAGEQWTVLTPTTPLPNGGALPPAYAWLAAHPDGGVLAEFPLMPGLRDPARTTLAMYYQGAHRHPLLNGYSSFVPPTYIELVGLLDQDMMITAQDIGVLQSLDTRYILFNRPAYKERHWQRIARDMSRQPAAQLAGDWGDVTNGAALYILAPLPAAAYLHLAWALPAHAPAAATVPLTVTITNPYTVPLLARLDPRLTLVWRWHALDATGDAHALAAPPQRRGLDVPLVLPPGVHTFVTRLPATPPLPGRYTLQVELPRALPHYELDPPSDPLQIGP